MFYIKNTILATNFRLNKNKKCPSKIFGGRIAQTKGARRNKRLLLLEIRLERLLRFGGQVAVFNSPNTKLVSQVAGGGVLKN